MSNAYWRQAADYCPQETSLIRAHGLSSELVSSTQMVRRYCHSFVHEMLTYLAIIQAKCGSETSRHFETGLGL